MEEAGKVELVDRLCQRTALGNGWKAGEKWVSLGLTEEASNAREMVCCALVMISDKYISLYRCTA